MRSISFAAATAFFFLTALGCRADVERAGAETSVESYSASATLSMLDVRLKGRALRARFWLQNVSDGILSYEGCAAGKPVAHRQYSDGGTWKDEGAPSCDGQMALFELAPKAILKFDVELDAKRPSSRIGVRVTTRASEESTLVWSETVYYEAAPPK